MNASATATSSANRSKAAADGAVGGRVRALRDAMGLSLRDLAERSGVSAPMLSQVERGETSPTLAVAGEDRLRARPHPLAAPAPRRGRHVVVIREGDRRARRRKGHTVEELTPPLPGQRADVSAHVLAPGAATGGPDDPPLHEPGARETAVVQEGSIDLFIDGERHELGDGRQRHLRRRPAAPLREQRKGERRGCWQSSPPDLRRG